MSLAVYVLVGSSHVHGRVLCYEVNGEVTIEASKNGSCVSIETNGSLDCASIRLSITAASANESHCRSCRDVPIPVLGVHNSVTTTGAKTVKRNIIAPTTLTPTCIKFDVSSHDSAQRFERPQISHLIARIRCVVLLI